MNPDRWHPWTRFLPSPVINGFATLGPIGYWGKAPGTNGTVAGVLLYTVLFFFLSPLAYLVMTALLIYLAIAFCGEAEKRLFKRDPGEVILDEVAAIPICFFGLQMAIADFGIWAWLILLAGFGLFRLFDILKPFGIKRLQSMPGGLGVVVDDLAAGVATCICLHLLVYLIRPYLVSV
ncbi:MAG: phosphatidylglycerophosphatase A family protein [Puniceicoccales bacterium]